MSTAEQIDAEIERLEGQRREALAQAEDSDRKIEEMNERRIALAPPTFTGDEAADRELLTLEERSGQFTQNRIEWTLAAQTARLPHDLETPEA